MKIQLMTNEYPPYIYGGAGVHVDDLSRALSALCQVQVQCFGDQNVQSGNLSVRGFAKQDFSGSPQKLARVFDALQRGLDFNKNGIDADIVHVHTWYTHMAGIIAKLNYGIPLVLTVHSLEPLRPWKREQLAGGYDFSCWVEKTAIEMADAVIAVSQDTKKDILSLFNISPDKITVIPNGIDLAQVYKVNEPWRLTPYGINPEKPYLLFLGRITRQKGIIHLVRAIRYLKSDIQIVLSAGSPDTPEIAAEMEAGVQEARAIHPNIIWIKDMVPLEVKRALFSHASLFCCPSVYEPFGIINLEAMACEIPVVASAVGGIKEAVADGVTGRLVPVQMKNDLVAEPVDPEGFSRDLAFQIDALMADSALRFKMGQAGRQRVMDHFTWDKIARQTLELYQKLV